MTNRRLAALLMADVAGYSRIVGTDELGSIAAVRKLRDEVIAPAIASHNGRLVKTMGDGFLIEFGSAVKAVECATIIQARLPHWNIEQSIAAQGLKLRIGVHVGDVVIAEDGDVFGDGVNVTARLQAFAEPGSICLSYDAFRQIEGKLIATFKDTGEQNFKNIDRPVRVYTLAAPPGSPIAPVTQPLPDKPSIAVLPFANISGDPEQEYFADGIVEDIITALSRFRNLFVIARNSSFTYKGRAVDVKQVGRELGVRYVLEGSVRKAGAKLRITGQLIDASNGAHIWADRFDGALEEVFDLQDQVTQNVIGAIGPKLEQAEIDRAKRKPTESLDAYDLFLRGMASFDRRTQADNEDALQFFYAAMKRDHEFASAYALAAACYCQRKANGWVLDRPQEIVEATRLAAQASVLGRDDAVALCWSGWALAYVAHDLHRGSAMFERALVLNSNLAIAWHWGGWIKYWSGDVDEGLERLARAERLSPLDPLQFHKQSAIAHGYFFADRHEEALSFARKALHEAPTSHAALRIAAASAALAPSHTEAEQFVRRLQQRDPQLRVSNLRDALGPYQPVMLEKYEDALRRAGLPE